MFFRVTRAGRHQYVQIARSFRDGSAVKQQTLLSLGRLDVLRASGQLDALLRSGLRLRVGDWWCWTRRRPGRPKR